MKILQVHNAYQHVGGEDFVVTAEYEMFKQYGHEIYQWIIQNSGLDNASFIEKAKIAGQSIWSDNSYSQIKKNCENSNQI